MTDLFTEVFLHGGRESYIKQGGDPADFDRFIRERDTFDREYSAWIEVFDAEETERMEDEMQREMEFILTEVDDNDDLECDMASELAVARVEARYGWNRFDGSRPPTPTLPAMPPKKIDMWIDIISDKTAIVGTINVIPFKP